MLQSATTINQSIPDYAAQLNTMSLLRGKNTTNEASKMKSIFRTLSYLQRSSPS